MGVISYTGSSEKIEFRILRANYVAPESPYSVKSPVKPFSERIIEEYISTKRKWEIKEKGRSGTWIKHCGDTKPIVKVKGFWCIIQKGEPFGLKTPAASNIGRGCGELGEKWERAKGLIRVQKEGTEIDNHCGEKQNLNSCIYVYTSVSLCLYLYLCPKQREKTEQRKLDQSQKVRQRKGEKSRKNHNGKHEMWRHKWTQVLGSGGMTDWHFSVGMH